VVVVVVGVVAMCSDGIVIIVGVIVGIIVIVIVGSDDSFVNT